MSSGTTLTEMKVFTVLIRQSFDSIRCLKTSALIYFALVIAATASGSPALAITEGTRAVMTQCRNLAADQSAFEECLTIIERESELLLAAVEGDWLELLSQTEDSETTESGTPDQLQLITSRFREYREQVCLFSAYELDEISAAAAIRACVVSMNRQHTTFLQKLLIERKIRAEYGTFYRGYLLISDGKGLFQSCELRQDWVVDGDSEILDQIQSRYSEVTTDALELAYIELRGQIAVADGVETVMRVNRVNLVRPILDSDCTVKTVATESGNSFKESDDDTDNEISETVEAETAGDTEVSTTQASAAPTPASTIDSYGAAGFMYGYFGDWMAICAADAPQVCQARVQHSLSTEGDWQLLIDRSSDLVWRIRIVPTTDSHIVGSAMELSLDGVASATIPVASGQILLNQPQQIASGDAALAMINRMKTGATVELMWNGSLQSSSSLIFSLNGLVPAIDYFDSHSN